MSKRRGFVSPRRAARMLGVHSNTVYTWIYNNVLRNVERDSKNGYLYIDVKEVLRVKEIRKQNLELT